jgi:hypothetical protein
MRTLLALCAVLSFTACNNRPLDRLDGVLTGARTQRYQLPARTPIDVLLVIDNSGSMKEEQAKLVRTFPRLAALFTGLDADVRIAFTSTDPYDNGRFLGPADHTQLDAVAPGCEALLADDALPTILALGESPNLGQDCTDVACLEAALTQAFTCMATLGTRGGSIETGLTALTQATACDGPNARHFGTCCVDGRYDPACDPETALATFLRPDALLLMIVLSDEDDCSMPGGVPRDWDGEACLYNPDVLTPVEDVYRHLVALKARPAEQILMAALVGPRLLGPDGTDLRFGPVQTEAACDARDYQSVEDCCVGGLCATPVVACETTDGEAAGPVGVAFPGRRYQDLVALFEHNGVGCPESGAPGCATICGDDLAEPIDQVVATTQYIFSRYCLDARPACEVHAPEGPRGCRTAAEHAEPRNYPSVQVRTSCLSERCTDLVEPMYLPPDALVIDPYDSGCPSGASMRLAEPAPPGAKVVIEYFTEIAH